MGNMGPEDGEALEVVLNTGSNMTLEDRPSAYVHFDLDVVSPSTETLHSFTSCAQNCF